MTIPYPVAFRPRRESDDAYIHVTWRESYHRGNAAAGRVAMSRFKAQLADIVRGYLGSGMTVVACTPDDTDHVLGWACATPGVLQYVFVRSERQRAGLGSALVDLACPIGDYAHATTMGGHLARRFPLFYNPLAMVVVR